MFNNELKKRISILEVMMKDVNKTLEKTRLDLSRWNWSGHPDNGERYEDIPGQLKRIWEFLGVKEVDIAYTPERIELQKK